MVPKSARSTICRRRQMSAAADHVDRAVVASSDHVDRLVDLVGADHDVVDAVTVDVTGAHPDAEPVVRTPLR